MKTTLNLPDDLMREAMQTYNVKSKSEVITLALQELIRKKRVAALKNYKGKIDLEIDLDVLRNRNANSG
jgi:Arc/MetJ family transcription regulator